jgi:hypothetical protein
MPTRAIQPVNNYKLETNTARWKEISALQSGRLVLKANFTAALP